MLSCDNKLTLQIVANPMYHEHTKHSEFVISHHIMKGEIRICHVEMKSSMTYMRPNRVCVES